LYKGLVIFPHPKFAALETAFTGVTKQNGSMHVPFPDVLHAIFVCEK
jgi:hypothetical protein